MAAADSRPPADESPNDDLTDELLRDELLKSVQLEELAAAESELAAQQLPKAPKRGLFGLTHAQTVFLGTLLVIVLVVWLALGATIGRSLSALRDRQESQAPQDAETEGNLLGLGSSVDATGLPPATKPTPTLTPPPAIATQYDGEILRNPDNVDLRLNRGRVYLDAGAFEAALQDYRHAAAVDPTRAEAYVGIAWANLYLRQWMNAEEAFLQALALDPDQVEARFGLGQLRYYQGRFSEAAVKFERIVELQAGDPEAAAWWAMAKARSGDIEGALAVASQAVEAAPDSPLPYIARSWAHRLQAPPDIDAAQGDLLYAQNLSPYAFETLNALAEFYLDYRLERLGEAEVLARYAINWAKSDLERAVGLHTLSRIYIQQERLPEAEATLTQAADLLDTDGSIVLPDVFEDLERIQKP